MWKCLNNCNAKKFDNLLFNSYFLFIHTLKHLIIFAFIYLFIIWYCSFQLNSWNYQFLIIYGCQKCAAKIGIN